MNAVCRCAYLQLHNISGIRRYFTQDATKILAHAYVISKLDCSGPNVTELASEIVTYKPFSPMKVDGALITLMDVGEPGVESRDIC